MLTDDVIHSVRSGTKNQKLSDEKGLYLLIAPGGGRLWRLKYYFPPRTPGNKEKCLALGSCPEVSLAQARERRDAAPRDIANGIDTHVRRICQKIYFGNAFEAVASA